MNTHLSTRKPIFVTGVTGYVGSWIALTLLQRGYKVLGTSRNPTKFEKLVENHKEFKKAFEEKRFENIIVEDLAKCDFENLFELHQREQGEENFFEIVIHSASPCHQFEPNQSIQQNSKSFEETYLKPAIDGSLNLLRACHKIGKVKKLIYTGSFGAVMDMDDNPFSGKVYDESNWNSATYQSAKESKEWIYAYRASKTIAEKALYDYQKQNQLQDQIQICSIIPPRIYGPWIHPISNLDQLNASLRMVYQFVTQTTGTPSNKPKKTDLPAMVDVRDVALAHILAFENENANGRFLLCSSTEFGIEKIAKEVQNNFPRFYNGPKLNVVEEEEKDGFATNTFRIDCSKAKTQLAIRFIDPNKTIFDMISQMEQFELVSQTEMQK